MVETKKKIMFLIFGIILISFACAKIPHVIIDSDFNLDKNTTGYFIYNDTYTIYFNDTQLYRHENSTYLNLSGTNANQNITIGFYDMTANKFYGLFNILIDSFVEPFSSNFIYFNGTTLGFNVTHRNRELNSTYLNLSGTNANQDLNLTPYTILMVDNHGNILDLEKTAHEHLHMTDDSMVHNTNLTITASGGVVTATIKNKQYPTHNIGYYVDHVNYRLIRTTSSVNATLTEGTWVSPQTNYLYVDSDQQLKASITMPTGEYAWAGIVEVANCTGSNVHYYAVQDEIPTMYELIKNNYMRAWYDNPIYENGIDITIDLTVGSFATTAGNLRFALTSVPFEARNTSLGTKFVYVDDPDGAYTLYDDLTGINKYQDGGSIGINKYFKFMVYGLVEDNGNDYYYITVQNEPTTECTSISCAESDATHKMNYQFSDRFKRTGFRIAEVVLQHKAGGNVPQIQSNGLLYRQLLDQNLVVFGGTSAVALGLDEVLENNPNTDNNIISTANITADWFKGKINISDLQDFLYNYNQSLSTAEMWNDTWSSTYNSTYATQYNLSDSNYCSYIRWDSSGKMIIVSKKC